MYFFEISFYSDIDATVHFGAVSMALGPILQDDAYHNIDKKLDRFKTCFTLFDDGVLGRRIFFSYRELAKEFLLRDSVGTLSIDFAHC